ncbi:MAG TPA: hypothetical protein VEP49_05120, partial [Acidimicrobiia bacterium]|nr:hypothetical protein [Acidimicrobiia bacterium]
NTGSNTNSGFNGNNPPPFGLATCEAYGGTFTFVGTGTTIWTCTGLALLDHAAAEVRSDDLLDSCAADGGGSIVVLGPGPQTATCST